MSIGDRRGPPPRVVQFPASASSADLDKLRHEHDFMQRRIEKQARVRLARDLLVEGRAATVADAFRIADEFGEEALRRVPHVPYDEGAIVVGDLGPFGGPFGVG